MRRRHPKRFELCRVREGRWEIERLLSREDPEQMGDEINGGG